MYHSVIGRKLVAAASMVDGTEYSIEGFFLERYLPLFYGEDRFLQCVNNSPFDQAITKQKKALTPQLFKECSSNLVHKIREIAPDASFFLGGPAAGCEATTSGQVTSMKVPIHCDDVYASWLGAAAGLMVEGGQILLLDHQDVLTEIYLGWQRYRILLRESPQLKAMQVNAWNGQWVAHRLGNRANVLFHPDSDGAKLNTIGWVQLLFALAYHMREGPATVQTIYIYALGQTNETVGFVNLNLPKIRLPVELYSRLFTVPEGMPPMAFEELYDTACGLKEASRFGEIGTSAIRPRMAADPGKTAEKQLKFDTYRTWLIAMLDNKELYERAQSFARELMAFQSVDERGKSTRKSAVDELLKQKTRKGFVDALSGILEKGGIDVAACEATVTGIVELPVDRVPLYISLINFSFRALAAK